MNCFYIFQGCIHFILLLPERGVHQRKFVFEFQYGIAPDDLAEADFASLNTTHRQARTSRTAYAPSAAAQIMVPGAERVSSAPGMQLQRRRCPQIGDIGCVIRTYCTL